MRYSKSLLLFFFISFSAINHSYGQYDAYKLQLSVMMDMDGAIAGSTDKTAFKTYFTPGLGLFYVPDEDFRIGFGLSAGKRITYYQDMEPVRGNTTGYYGAYGYPLAEQQLSFLTIPLYFSYLTIDQKKMSGGLAWGLVNNFTTSARNTWSGTDNSLNMAYYQNGKVKNNEFNRAPYPKYSLFFLYGYFMDFDICDQAYFSINPNVQFGFMFKEKLGFDASVGIQARIGLRCLKNQAAPDHNNDNKAKVIKIKMGK